MNQIIPVTTAPPEFGLVPTTMAEAIKLAEMMASAKLVPKDLQKSPADCLMVIQQAIRWQMDPFAVAQECSVIQGKLMHSGKLVAAVINARGNLIERLSFTYAGNGDSRIITVSGRLATEAAPRTVTVALKDARTNNNVWRTQPDQQLMYHGARVWARRHTPELMLGVWSPEEFEPVPRAPAAPNAPAEMVEIAKPELHDAETGEIVGENTPVTLPVLETNGEKNWIAFGVDYKSSIEKSKTIEEAEEWMAKNRAAFDEMIQEAPKAYKRLKEIEAKVCASLAKPEDIIGAG
jgi:hypothetical protein